MEMDPEVEKKLRERLEALEKKKARANGPDLATRAGTGIVRGAKAFGGAIKEEASQTWRDARRDLDKLNKEDTKEALKRGLVGAQAGLGKGLKATKQGLGMLGEGFAKGFSRGKNPEGSAPLSPEVEAEVKKEIRELPKIEREKLELGINNLGFALERKKSDWFANIFGSLSTKFDRKSAMARFTRGLHDSYKKDAEMADKKARADKAPAITKISNVAYLAKNVLRPLRLIADATGISPTGVQRVIMAGGMFAARTTGAMKEARLENEAVIEKTRIQNAKDAYNEAWAIHEKALGRAGDEGVSAEALKKAYLMEMPKDLQERLRDTSVADTMAQKLLRKHLEFDVNRLNKNIEKIENNKKLSPEKREAQKEQLLRRWEKRLTDYDRVLTQTGTVDGYAMAARYAESTSKNVVRAATVQTLYLTLDKIWDGISHVMSRSDAPDVVLEPQTTTTTTTSIPETTPLPEPGAPSQIPTIRQDPSEMLKDHPKFGMSNAPAPEAAATPLEPVQGTGADVRARIGKLQSAEEIQKRIFSKLSFRGAPSEIPTTPASEATVSSGIPVSQGTDPKILEQLQKTGVGIGKPLEMGINTGLHEDAVIQKGEGIEHALRRQIEHNEAFARNLGYKGEMNDTKALHRFSGSAAHRVALDKGYVDKVTGEEVRVRRAGQIAYQLKLEGNELKVGEYKMEGDEWVSQEEHGNREFEKNREEYEYQHDRTTQRVLTTETDTPAYVRADVERVSNEMLKKMEPGEIPAEYTPEVAPDVEATPNPVEETRAEVLKNMPDTDVSKPEAAGGVIYRPDNLMPPEFAKNPFDLPRGKLAQAYEASIQDYEFPTKRKGLDEFQTPPGHHNHRQCDSGT